jgi:hypothetical protein
MGDILYISKNYSLMVELFIFKPGVVCNCLREITHKFYTCRLTISIKFYNELFDLEKKN